MIAILSDVHANLEALQAVMDDVRQRGISKIFFLGDIVGYGPDPAAVLDYIKHFEFCLLGNHDEACVQGPPKSFNPIATRAALWTRAQIWPDESGLSPAEKQRRSGLWQFLKQLRPVRIVDETMFVHDTPAEPGSWRYVREFEEANKGFKKFPALNCFFFGHSHRPAVWTEQGYEPAEPGRKFDFKKRVMVNVGSVGQPRDNDPRACYVLLEPDGFRFFRVPYDLQKTQAKILAIPELDNRLAKRLGEGR